MLQVNLSDGGVPKLPVPATQAVRVTRDGLHGDRQRDLRYHGGPERAVCLFSAELIASLAAEGHPIAPGTVGENLTLAGLDWTLLRPGARLAFDGGVVLEVASDAAPCPIIGGSFRDGAYERIAQKRHPGESRLYCRVLVEGEVRAGERVVRLAPGEAPVPPA